MLLKLSAFFGITQYSLLVYRFKFNSIGRSLKNGKFPVNACYIIWHCYDIRSFIAEIFETPMAIYNCD
jgi:hypothetical protein